MAIAAALLLACQICYPIPKASLADRLVEAETVLLAREDPDRPFQYRAIETLKGEARPIPLFLDSSTRRMLRVHPDRSVLLVAKPWRRVAVVEGPVRKVVDELLAKPRDFDYFAALFDSEHAVLRDLAHLHVARAPYARIRTFGDRVPRAILHRTLRDPKLREYWKLHILLLGRSRNREDRALIRSKARKRGLERAAWATAWIEQEGEVALRYYAGRRLEDELQPALSVHGSEGRTELRDAIVRLYAVALSRDVRLAGPIIDDLVAWKRTEMRPALRDLEKRNATRLPPDVRLKLRAFLRSTE
ncbi:MAG: hypothetical protein AAGD14_13210 [Planctomycetota bacterium]